MEKEAEKELSSLLVDLGYHLPDVYQTNVSGLLTANTNSDPHEIIAKIKKVVMEEPWTVRYLQRLIPVDEVVNTDIDEIREAVAKLATRIEEQETFRITVEKRFCNLPSSHIVTNVATVLERRVSLENHDWIVLIEIIGKETGISIIRPEAIFRSQKIKRES